MKTFRVTLLLLVFAALGLPVYAQAVVFTQNFDTVVVPALPAGWTVSGVGVGLDWVSQATGADTAPNCVFTNDPATVSDRYLDSPVINLPGATNTLTFRHNYATEATFDGGVLEIKIGAGAFADIVVAGGTFTAGAYTGPISLNFSSPIAGRNAWNGTSAAYVTTTCTLPVAAQGQPVQFRWRMATDSSLSATGWNVDTISISTQGPQLTVAPVAGAAQSVFTNATGPGGNGLRAVTFTIAANGLPDASLTTIQIQAAGSGNDQTAFSQVAVYRDLNDSAAFEAGADTLIGVAALAFPSDNGTLSFSVQAAEQLFAASVTRRYFVVVKLAGAALSGDVFNFIVSDITVTGTNASKNGVPTVAMTGLVISAPGFNFSDDSPGAPVTAIVGSTDNMCQKFSIAYPAGPDNHLTSVTVTALGTGHDVSHLVRVALWLDEGSGLFEVALDTLVDDAVYSADNGTAVFDVTSLPNYQAGQSKTFFVTYDFTLTGIHAQTFKCYVSAAGGALFGAVINGLPLPGVTGTQGLVMTAVMLTATLNGPGSALTVQNNSMGTTGSGELLCDVTLSAASGQAWNLTGLTFAATGTAAHDAAYSELGLYEDSGNGIWDGSLNDGAAAGTLTGFGTGPGYQASFTLSNGVINSGASRRFFLAAKLNGTATTSQTLNTRFEAIIGTPPAGGIQSGIPTASSTALVIDTSVLTVANGPGAPTNVLHKSGTPLPFLMAKYRFGASNDAVTVSGVTLTGTGSGNWSTSMDSTIGVQVYRDNGDGVFDSLADPLLYQDAGAVNIGAVFATSVVVPTRGTQEIWVRVNLLGSAGGGAATPLSYTVTIAQASDVSATHNVLIGTPAPNGAILSVVDFFVTNVDPLTDALAGGKILTITGSGFMSPFTMTIGGVVCPGTPTVTPTQVTGIQVPSGFGSAQPIVVSSGSLAPVTLTQTFDYRNPGNPKVPSTGSGCAVGIGSAGMLVGVALIVVGALRRRRKN